MVLGLLVINSLDPLRGVRRLGFPTTHVGHLERHVYMIWLILYSVNVLQGNFHCTAAAMVSSSDNVMSCSPISRSVR
jgi:hypothetical protein